MQAQRLGDLLADAMDRVERAGGVLENHRDAPAAHVIETGGSGTQKLLATQRHAAGDAGGGGDAVKPGEVARAIGGFAIRRRQAQQGGDGGNSIVELPRNGDRLVAAVLQQRRLGGGQRECIGDTA